METKVPRKVALLIGVSEYGEGIPSLSASPNDVAAIARVLKNPHMGGFDEVTPLINPDAKAMRLAVQKIFTYLRLYDLAQGLSRMLASQIQAINRSLK
ncbi:MAG: caspase family protein [Cyanobacteria bacterium P01_A01_bin.83]